MVIGLTTISTEFRDDLLGIVETYFPKSESMEFSRFLLIDKYRNLSGISRLSDSDRSQLEFEITPAKDRYHIDRTITMAKKHLDDEQYLKLLTNLSELCISHGLMNFAHEIIIKIKRESKINSISANSMLMLSDLFSRKGKWDKSLSTSRKAKKLFTVDNDMLGLAKCDNLIGTIYGERGNLNKAKSYFEESLKNAIAENDKKMIAMLEMNLGIINNINEQYDTALQYFNNSLNMFEELGDLRRLAEVRHNIGMMYKEQKYYHSALQQFDSAISIAIRNEYYPVLAISYISKAEILLNLEEYSFAAAIAEKAMEIAHILDDKITIAEVYRLQGIIHKHLKNYKIAENNLLSALRLNKKLDIQLNIAECYYDLAQLFSEIHDKDEERKYLNESLVYYKKINAQSHIDEIQAYVNSMTN
jgi:tetratricopeptide (TPR) repeat protein